MPPDGELVRLTVVSSEAEAEVARGLLAEAGIPSLHRPTDVAAGALDGVAASGARELLVRAADLDAARKLLAAAREEGPDGPSG